MFYNIFRFTLEESCGVLNTTSFTILLDIQSSNLLTKSVTFQFLVYVSPCSGYYSRLEHLPDCIKQPV